MWSDEHEDHQSTAPLLRMWAPSANTQIPPKVSGCGWIHKHIPTAPKSFITHAPTCVEWTGALGPCSKHNFSLSLQSTCLSPQWQANSKNNWEKYAEGDQTLPKKCTQLRPILRNYFKVLITLRGNNSWQKLQLPKKWSVMQQQF